MRLHSVRWPGAFISFGCCAIRLKSQYVEVMDYDLLVDRTLVYRLYIPEIDVVSKV